MSFLERIISQHSALNYCLAKPLLGLFRKMIRFMQPGWTLRFLWTGAPFL